MADANDDNDAAAQQGPARPLLRIVNPDATPEEIAAVVAVLAGLGGSEPPAPRQRPQWGAPHRHVRRPLRHGAGGWRSSTLPG